MRLKCSGILRNPLARPCRLASHARNALFQLRTYLGRRHHLLLGELASLLSLRGLAAQAIALQLQRLYVPHVHGGCRIVRRRNGSTCLFRGGKAPLERCVGLAEHLHVTLEAVTRGLSALKRCLQLICSSVRRFDDLRVFLLLFDRLSVLNLNL